MSFLSVGMVVGGSLVVVLAAFSISMIMEVFE